MSSGHVVMLLAGALGVLCTTSLLRRADDTTSMLAAARDLAPGTVVAPGDVRPVRAGGDADALASFVPADAPVAGQVVTAPVAAGTLLTSQALRPPAAGAATRVMSFALARPRAVGGALRTGDRVDVLAVAKATGEATYVLGDVEVVAVDDGGGGPLGSGGDEITVSLALDAKGAAEVATALETAAVTLVRATGAPPIATRAAVAGGTG